MLEEEHKAHIAAPENPALGGLEERKNIEEEPVNLVSVRHEIESDLSSMDNLEIPEEYEQGNLTIKTVSRSVAPSVSTNYLQKNKRIVKYIFADH